MTELPVTTTKNTNNMLYKRMEPNLPKHPLADNMRLAEFAAFQCAWLQVARELAVCKIEIPAQSIDENDFKRGAK